MLRSFYRKVSIGGESLPDYYTEPTLNSPDSLKSHAQVLHNV